MPLKYKLIGDNDYIFDPQGTILANRGIKDIDAFLNLSDKVTYSHALLKNIDKATECLIKHIENKSKILIVVDPDVDGYTSGSIMYQYLKMIDDKINIKWALHDDKTHGLKNIEVTDDIKLIIVPDAGSNDFRYHHEFKAKGIDIIVLDHHEIEGESENAIIVNSQLGGYKNLNLSGAGITYKFCKALDNIYWTDYADYLLDLVALGCIADSMSMKELETRYYVQQGLNDINNEFFRALLKQQEYSTKGKINITTMGFYISPMINAVIRVGTLQDKIDMFKSFIGVKELVKYKPRGSDEILVPLVDDMARRCTNIKAKQGRMVDKIVKNIEEFINENKLYNNKILLIHDIDGIEKGLTGLIANKIAGTYKKPTLILSGYNDKGVYSGSGRGYDKGELADFKEVLLNSNLCESAKGHSNAFGVSIHKDNLNKLNEAMNDLLKDYNFDDIYIVDFKLNDNSISKELVSSICELEDVWGKEVDEPFILITDIKVNEDNTSLLGKNENTIAINTDNMKYVIFRTGRDSYNKMINSGKINIIGRANMNSYNGEKYAQIIVNALEIN